VLRGDVEYPEWIYVKALSLPEGKERKIQYFEIHERDIAAGLFYHAPKKA
jgi:hypothetical protein